MSYEGARVPLHRLLFARQSPRDLYFGQLRRNMNHDQTMDDVETIYFVICNLTVYCFRECRRPFERGAEVHEFRGRKGDDLASTEEKRKEEGHRGTISTITR